MRTGRSPGSFLVGALAATVAAAACGGASPVQSDLTLPPVGDDPVLDGDAPPGPSRSIALIAEAWPRTGREEEGAWGPDAMTDGITDRGGWVVDGQVHAPWVLVYRVARGPAWVGAIAIAPSDADPDSRPPGQFDVYGMLGDIPLSRSNYPALIESSVYLGSAEMESGSGLHLFALEDPALLHFVWVRVRSPLGEGPLGLSEFAAFTPEQMDALVAAGHAASVNLIVPLDDVLSGAGDPEGEPTATGDHAEAPDEGSGEEGGRGGLFSDDRDADPTEAFEPGGSGEGVPPSGP